MPELPDVEGFRRTLAQHASGRRIDDVDVIDAGAVRGCSAKQMRAELSGRTFGTPRRHGKWLIAPLRGKRQHSKAEPSLLFHFGMTGSLVWSGCDEPRHSYDRIAFVLGDHELRYRDLRKLQGVRLLDNDAAVDEWTAELGPDAADISSAELLQRLTNRRRQLKQALMDQSTVAGLGNLLTDELLWRARLGSTRSTSDLSEADARRLHSRMTTMLQTSMRNGRVPTRKDWLTGRRDDDDPACPRCDTRLRRRRVGGRSTVWCPHCQPD